MYQFRHFNLTGIDIDKGKSANTHRKSSPHCQSARSHPTLAFQTCMRSIFPGSCSPCSPFLSVQHWQGKTQTKRFMAEQSIWISHTPSLVEDKNDIAIMSIYEQCCFLGPKSAQGLKMLITWEKKVSKSHPVGLVFFTRQESDSSTMMIILIFHEPGIPTETGEGLYPENKAILTN